MSSDRPLKADGLLVLVTVLAAAGWLFSLFALRGLPTLFFIGTRFLLAGSVLAVFGLRQLSRLGVRDVWRAAVTGVAICLSMTLWTEGLQLTDNLGVGAFICSLGNILAPVFGWVLFKIRISVATWVAVAVATAGMACLSINNGVGFSPADLFFLASAVANSLYLNLNNRFASRIAVLPLAVIQLTVVGALALAVSPFLEHWPAAVGVETIGWFLASVLIATSLRYFLLVKGQAMAPISHTALIMNLEPVWTAVLAAVCLGTTISGVQFVGCALIFLALLLHHLPWWRAPRAGRS
ncbi:DMT family transporter [Telmatospirillum sp.]|uniref:DMT family transporter n=1 Tax=Telmatospirillum sp. TaxID=2079197 RepID=UPI002844AA57|nr:DMT family transporter [Telmatospirillum sp.]MDR3439403.1 DMT family transporter [Telmatospirillum sp.]